MNIRAIIVDDERLARVELEHLLRESNIDIIDSCAESEAAILSINKNIPDIVFLDINMPEKNGFEIAEEILDSIHIVFVTAYDEYALKAFEINALDYLVKPLDRKRLDKTIEKCKINKEAFAYRLAQKLDSADRILDKKLKDHILVKDSDDTHFIKLNEISAFSSYGNYVKLCLSDNKVLMHSSLNDLEKRLDTSQFFRANRYTIINIKHIQRLLPTSKSKIRCLLNNGMEIDFSERKSIQFRKKFSV